MSVRQERPVYQRIADALRKRILSGELNPGARLPSESGLMTEFEVSRGTARQAFAVLKYEGLVESVTGSGVYVRPRFPNRGQITAVSSHGNVPLPHTIMEPEFSWTKLVIPPATWSKDQPATITMTEVDEVQNSLHMLYSLDQRVGGDTLRDSMLAQFRQISWWLNHASYQSDVGQALQSLASYAAVNAAWFFLDSGISGSDVRYLLTEALTAAELADDKPQTVYVLEMMSIHSRWLDRPKEAIHLAQRAQQLAKGLGSPRMQALVALREAQGWALLGDAPAVVNTHTQAMKHLEHGPSDADPQWLNFLDEADAAGEVGRCYQVAQQPEQAEQHFRDAAAISRGPHRQRNSTEWNFELARALGQNKKIDEACTIARNTLPALAEMSSTRIRTMFHNVLRTLQPHADEPCVRDLTEQARALFPSSPSFP